MVVLDGASVGNGKLIPVWNDPPMWDKFSFRIAHLRRAIYSDTLGVVNFALAEVLHFETEFHGLPQGELFLQGDKPVRSHSSGPHCSVSAAAFFPAVSSREYAAERSRLL